MFIEIFKDISLLDCLGLQYPCCNRSFNPSIRIPKSVSLYYSVADFNLLFLVIWIVAGSSAAPRHLVVEGHFLAPAWQNALGITGLAMSMVLNALVMGLMVFRISKVFQRLKPTSDEQILGATGGSTLRPMIFVLIESGMALVSVQLVRLVVASLVASTHCNSEGAVSADSVIVGFHEMLNVNMTSNVFYFQKCYFADECGLGYNTDNRPSTGVNGVLFPP